MCCEELSAPVKYTGFSFQLGTGKGRSRRWGTLGRETFAIVLGRETFAIVSWTPGGVVNC